MANDAAHEFAAKVWSRAVHHKAFLVAASGDLLVCIVDGEGLESAWLERAPSAPRASSDKRDEQG
jgi:hypothetical protein